MRKNDIRLFSTWVPRELNERADFYSKMVDTDDWSIDYHSYRRICKEFGKPTIDRFYDELNRKVEQFNSNFHCPGTSAVDAFTQDWSDTSLNWLSPPPTDQAYRQYIRHLRLCNAKGILLVPQWPSSHFWPLNGCLSEACILVDNRRRYKNSPK